MKKATLYIFIAIAVFVSACNKCDDCQFGECENGDCELWQTTVSGSYMGNLNCGGNLTPNEFVTITPDAEENYIRFDNGFRARMNSSASFTIPSQTYFDASEGMTLSISGSGTFVNGALSFNVVSANGNQTIACSFSGN